MSVSLINSFVRATYVAPPGEVVFTANATWTCPAGVTSVSVVAVGGGGAGNHGWGGYVFGGNYPGGSGGGGGGLGWKNNITVTPGQTYTVVVGSGGYDNSPNTRSTPGGKGIDGEDSYFISPTMVKGGGGETAYNNVGGAGGTYVGDGGGRGGSCTENNLQILFVGCGGGGAGGYSGTGGADTQVTRTNTDAYYNTEKNNYSAQAGPAGNSGAANSGAGGSGGTSGSGEPGPGGGGVGIYGKGVTGAGGSAAPGWRDFGGPGSGGSGGENGKIGVGLNYVTRYSKGGDGGLYGGGGGGASIEYSTALAGSGGAGVVRIIWGTGRSFPSNAA